MDDTHVVTVECPCVLVASQHASGHAIRLRPTNSHWTSRQNLELEVPLSIAHRVMLLNAISSKRQLA